MGVPAPIQIDHGESFEHLAKAPIVEAIIEIRARAESAWDEETVSSRIKSELPDYPTRHPLYRGTFTAEMRIDRRDTSVQSDADVPALTDQGWFGLRAESSDGRQIAAFTRDHFRFSRLRPYGNWKHTQAEALRLWGHHLAIASTSFIHRVGVRFINRLEVAVPPDGLDFSEYFVGLEAVPVALPAVGFMYSDSLGVPGHEYFINVVRTFQPLPDSARVALLLDIDAFRTEPFATDRHKLGDILEDLHWLKNKVFFSAMSARALEICR